MDLVMLLSAILLLLIGIFLGGLLRMKWVEGGMLKAREATDRLLALAHKESEEIRKETLAQAKDESMKMLEQGERELRNRRAEVQRMERRVESHLQTLDRRIQSLSKKEEELFQRSKALDDREKELQEKERGIEDRYNVLVKRLEEVAHLSAEEAKRELIEKIADQARKEAAERAHEIVQEVIAGSEQEAKRIMAHAIQRGAGDFAAERTVTLLTLPTDDLKGRIIGKEGRNIRALELATATDIIIDDTPQMVVISSHNPIRREIAKRALEKMISDGRIHPARIEEATKEAKAEIDAERKKIGEETVSKMDIGTVDPHLVELLGTLHFRYADSQDILEHALEVASFAGAMAAEIGLDPKSARRAGLLHDIGKAVEGNVEDSHAVVGAELLAKYGESSEIVEAVKGHHESNPTSLLAILVQAADQLSIRRPGARTDRFHHAIQRLEQIEKTVATMEGIERCYVIESGKEVRVIVNPNAIPEEETTMLCNRIMRKIRDEKLASGNIQVSVVREARSSSFIQ